MYETTRDCTYIFVNSFTQWGIRKYSTLLCFIVTVAEVSLTSSTKSTTESKLHSPLVASSKVTFFSLLSFAKIYSLLYVSRLLI